MSDRERLLMDANTGPSIENRLASLTAWAYQIEKQLGSNMRTNIDIEALSARLHDIYQKEAHRQGDTRHKDSYEELSEETKEFDRALARWIAQNFVPAFDPKGEIPPA